MKQFVMGAKLAMQDMFSKGISAAGQATKAFAATVGGVNSALSKYAQQTNKAQQSTKQFKQEGDNAVAKARAWISNNGRLGASFSLIKKGITTVIAAFGLWKAKSWLIDSNADMETYRNTLNIVMKDQKKAGETLQWATKFAAQTPFEIPGIVEATTRLTTYGMQAQKVLPIIGDMASVMGKDLMQAVEAVADAQTGETERLKEFGITKQMLIDKAKGLNLKIVDSKGSITDMKAFNATLFALMEERFKGGMEAQSKTFKGMLSNAQDFIGSMGRTLGAPIFDRIKSGFQVVMDKASAVQSSGVFDGIAGKIGSSMDRAGRYLSTISWLFGEVFGRIGREHAPQIKQLEDAFKSAIGWLDTNGRAAFNWLSNEGIPKAVHYLGEMSGKVLDIANFFQNNWQQALPIIATVTTYLLLNKAAVMGLVAAQKAALIIEQLQRAWAVAATVISMYRNGATLATIAQWAWNAAMTANPVGVIIMAIAALVGIIVLCVQHWDDIVNAVINAWNWFRKLIGGVPDWALALMGPIGPLLLIIKHFEEVKAAATAAIDAIKNGWGKVKSFFGFGEEGRAATTKNKVGKNAVGTKSWRGGWTWVGERGPELMRLPGGTQISSNYESRQMVNPAGSRAGNNGNVSIGSLVDKIEINGANMDSQELLATIMDQMHELMRQAKEIAGSADMGELLA